MDCPSNLCDFAMRITFKVFHTVVPCAGWNVQTLSMPLNIYTPESLTARPWKLTGARKEAGLSCKPSWLQGVCAFTSGIIVLSRWKLSWQFSNLSHILRIFMNPSGKKGRPCLLWNPDHLRRQDGARCDDPFRQRCGQRLLPIGAQSDGLESWSGSMKWRSQNTRHCHSDEYWGYYKYAASPCGKHRKPRQFAYGYRKVMDAGNKLMTHDGRLPTVGVCGDLLFAVSLGIHRLSRLKWRVISWNCCRWSNGSWSRVSNGNLTSMRATFAIASVLVCGNSWIWKSLRLQRQKQNLQSTRVLGKRP